MCLSEDEANLCANRLSLYKDIPQNGKMNDFSLKRHPNSDVGGAFVIKTSAENHTEGMLLIKNEAKPHAEGLSLLKNKANLYAEGISSPKTSLLTRRRGTILT